MPHQADAAALRPARKSPLRSATMTALAARPMIEPGSTRDPRPTEITAPQLRQMQISEFTGWLRTQTNKHKRPFQGETIIGYAETARALDRWMTEREIDGDFTACDTAVLNEFFAAYRHSHTQGGTNTRQRRLHHLFNWLLRRYDHPDPVWPAMPCLECPYSSAAERLACCGVGDSACGTASAGREG